ncbi:MAG: DNA polymerase III subunit gamma/tau [Oleispira antarctica]|uniref:DNA polymerase III subunit gamma/tau n=1 Tax=Oleispira antarctica RB-8 TaxID=698738 RepID=R4YSL1_OLEAN|nr:DNA polymerase III subunit gamma/tau [Oleispira antarctica]MBQ0793600.1 DNA polymerase III subunit gamma/tau [Oleispira antarctica]CCK76288.1 DNA-directed DNA polymerase III, tau and gamma subunits [Oleispira antarctica RB-8]
MSYQVLARKWRPRFFSEMVGQEHVLRALINALNDQRLHHAYLFTGTRGVGKTTIARILAKCLNCEQGVSATPCGECSSCREIAEGRFVDLIEVDAASRTKVEDTRELLDNVQYAPTRGRYKVYLIDEVHMLSTHSFNALLKTLEEPPEHVKFLLATTDPQKLPITVLSRCLQFSLKNMTPEKIVSHLETVLKAEDVRYEDTALWQLGRAAQGSMRDALSLTDQAIAYGQGEVFEHQVNAMLGTIDRGRVFKLAEILATGQVAELLSLVAAMAEHGPDYDEVVQALMQLWHKVAVAQVAPSSVDNTEGDKAAIMQLAAAMRPEDIQLFYQTALVGRKDLPLAADPRQGFEMILLRMLAFKPVNSAPLNLDLVGSLEAPGSVKLLPDPAESSQPVETFEEKKPLADSELAPEPVVEQVEAPVVEHPVYEDAVYEDAVYENPVAETSVFERSGLEGPVGESPALDSAIMDNSVSEQPANDISVVEIVKKEPIKVGAADLLNNPLPVVANLEPVAQDIARMGKDIVPEAAFDFNWQQLTNLNWWQWVRHLPLAGMPMAIALNSALISRHENQLVMDVDPDQGALFNDSQRQRIEQVLCDITGLPVQLLMHVQLPRGETPHQRRTRLMAEQFAQAGHAIMEDEVVQALVTEFEAHIIEGSIRPLTATH